MKKQYIRSERAHFMCPNMHFGMKMELAENYNADKVKETVAHLALAHPFLRSVIAYEEDTDVLYYQVTESSKVGIYVKESVSSLWEDYRSLSTVDWNVFENGMLKIFVYPGASGMTVLFVAHHLLTDGRGLLELAQEFARDYTAGTAPVYAEEVLIESVEELPEKSRLSGISKWLIKRANKQWRKENRKVNYEQYRQFAVNYGQTHSVAYENYTVRAKDVENIVADCRANGVSVNDWLMAQMYLKTGVEKIIIAADIRSRLPRFNPGAMGNYSTAMGIVCKPKSTDIMETAKQVHALVQKHMQNNRTFMLVLACYFEMEPTLLDAAAISALGGFESKAAQFVGGGMFGLSRPKSHSITNLGRVEDAYIQSLYFIPPASPAAKFTLGVVTLNGVMYACSSENR